MFKETGVIYAMNLAKTYGYDNSDDWVNMGQGSPNIANSLHIDINIKPKYSNTSGINVLRNQISDFYNTYYNINSNVNNINISNGGRLCLSKLLYMYKNKKVACISPEYTAYYELFLYFNINYIDLNVGDKPYLNIDDLIKSLKKEKIELLLLSNPKNPTGYYYNLGELNKLVRFLKEEGIIAIIDEVYSFYVYDNSSKEPLSICNSIDTIQDSNIIIINGLTKGWKLPGFRLCWILANQNIIKNIQSITSFFDGGPSIITQTICLKNDYLSVNYIENLRYEIKKEYNEKRIFLIEELTKLKFIIRREPTSTFYIFASLDNLPKKIRTDNDFFIECLKEKLIVIPGHFFDMDKNIKYNNYIRFSYGSSLAQITKGVDILKKIIHKSSMIY